MKSQFNKISIDVKNILGITEQTIEANTNKPILISGKNASGKSSLATGIAAAMTLHRNPLGFPAGMSKWYLHLGEQDGEVIVRWTGADGAEAFSMWEPRGGNIAMSDTAPPRVSPMATGLVDILNASKADKVTQFERIFLPDTAELIGQVKDSLDGACPDGLITEIVGAIEQVGWESVTNSYLEHAKRYKSEWQKISGEHYGSAKAIKWRPDGWRVELEGVSVEESTHAVAEARTKVSELHVDGSITASQKVQAEDAAGKADEVRGEIDKLREASRKVQAELDEARSAYAETEVVVSKLKSKLDDITKAKPPEPQPIPRQNCPDCDAELIINHGKIESASNLPTVEQQRETHAAEVTKWQPGYDKALEAKQEKQADLDTMREKGGELAVANNSASEAYNRALGKLNALEAQQASLSAKVFTELDAKAMAAAEQAEQDARHNQSLVGKLHEATRAQANVVQYSAIARVVGPEGLRGVAVAKGLTAFHKALNKLTATAGDWPPVKIEADTYALTIDGRPARICSASEAWRARACLQIAFAQATGSAAVVIDGADILDTPDGVAELCTAVAKQGIAVIITATDSTERPFKVAAKAFQIHKLGT